MSNDPVCEQYASTKEALAHDAIYAGRLVYCRQAVVTLMPLFTSHKCFCGNDATYLINQDEYSCIQHLEQKIYEGARRVLRYLPALDD